MPEADVVSGWNGLGSTDPDEEAVLADRLRLVAESLNAQFHGLSKADAERLVLAAAHDVLSSASVMQFVPTFAERRARSLLQTGYSISVPEATVDAADPAGTAAPPLAVTDVPGPTPSDGPGLLPPATHSLAPPWPDDFYASEAKRLLERARDLRAASLAPLQPDALA